MSDDPTPVVAADIKPAPEKWQGRVRCGICGHERRETVSPGDDGFTGPKIACPACKTKVASCHRVQG